MSNNCCENIPILSWFYKSEDTNRWPKNEVVIVEQPPVEEETPQVEEEIPPVVEEVVEEPAPIVVEEVVIDEDVLSNNNNTNNRITLIRTSTPRNSSSIADQFITEIDVESLTESALMIRDDLSNSDEIASTTKKCMKKPKSLLGWQVQQK